MIRILLILSFLAGAASLSAYDVAQINRTYVDPSRDNREIPTQIYYPVLIQQVREGHREAFPLIVFGHGWLLPVSTYATLRDDLVSQGWILAFPTTESGLFPDHLNFALDLEFVAHGVLAENYQDGSELFGQVLQYSVLMGHSMGGGASVLAAANSSCDALVTLAAAETDPSAISNATQVTIPSLTLSGGSDIITPPDQSQIPIFQNLASTYKSYVSFNGVGHLNIYSNTLVLTAIRTWLEYALSGENSALAAWIGWLDQNLDNLSYINVGYPELAASDPHAAPVMPRLEIWPNPARSAASLRYRLNQGGRVCLALYDLRGRKLRTLFEGQRPPGPHQLDFATEDLPSGLYLARLQAGESESRGWLTLLK